jgi:hypothetical protein
VKSAGAPPLFPVLATGWKTNFSSVTRLELRMSTEDKSPRGGATYSESLASGHESHSILQVSTSKMFCIRA